ncbi:nickel pincer cofactor biosynthesis protein LarB [Anaerococcus marasmi]|uniref:nickel pincer cofactor biosynthesis protein LarB n=1 Tax=Anaerococcus marasmi TaxID=2057797 RepID=UPI000CFA2E2B|nr:nickel pincer cofactor biosynthesis protein LarB [Anaerococcus marasmi]
MNDKEFLENIKNGKMTIDEGLAYLKDFNFKDIDIAKLDFQRKNRRGFPETIFCQGKEDFALVEIFKAFAERRESVIGTRASKDQYELVKREIPQAEYDPTGRIISLEYESLPQIGNIAICTGGTADLFVAEEAALTAEFFGARVSRFYDVGVSGLHRMLNKIDEIKKANVIIAIAGMEGALATVLAGLVDKPIIAVPTSVGYGASFNGISALLTMLSTCAEGISVVNIDNGYGAAYAACQINKLIEEK